MLLGSVGEKAEVTDAHKAFWQNMEEEAANEFLGVQGHGLFLVLVSAVPVGEGNFSVLDFEDTVI